MPGIDGNGQGELVEVLVGIRRQTAGEIMFCGKNLSRLSVRKRWEKGVAYVPSDRHQDGLIMDADITSNFAAADILSSAVFQKTYPAVATATAKCAGTGRCLSGENPVPFRPGAGAVRRQSAKTDFGA